MNLLEAKQAVITAHPFLSDSDVETAAKRLVNVEAIAASEAAIQAAGEAAILAEAQVDAELEGLSAEELEARLGNGGWDQLTRRA